MTLEMLSLKFCGIEGTEGGACIASIISNKANNLLELDLTGNKLRPRGLQILSRSLKFNRKLEILSLAENEIDCDFEPAAYDIFCRSLTALKDALEQNKTLRSLDFSFNTISEEGALLLMPALDRSSLSANETLREAKFSTLLSKETFNTISRSGGGSPGGKREAKKEKRRRKSSSRGSKNEEENSVH